MHDGRQHLVARQARQRHLRIDALAHRRQCLGELHQPLVLGAVAHGNEIDVIAVLLAPLGIAAGRLQMAVLAGADPHVGPGRRNGERSDARHGIGIAHRLAAAVEIGEAGAALLPAYPRLAIIHIFKTGLLRVARGWRRIGGVARAAELGAATHRKPHLIRDAVTPNVTAVTPVVPGVRTRAGQQGFRGSIAAKPMPPRLYAS